MSGESLRIDRMNSEHAGELLTLQRAAYVTEARILGDPNIAPLTQTLGELREELSDPSVIAVGGWIGPRLVASTRIRINGEKAEIFRLATAPDQRGQRYSIDVLLGAAPYLPDTVREVWVKTSSEDAQALEAYSEFGFEHQRDEKTERITQAYLRKILDDE